MSDPAWNVWCHEQSLFSGETGACFGGDGGALAALETAGDGEDVPSLGASTGGFREDPFDSSLETASAAAFAKSEGTDELTGLMDCAGEG